MLQSGGARLLGAAPAGAAVTLTFSPPLFAGASYHGAADATGQWTITDLTAPPNAGPFTLTLAAAGETRVARGVFFGFVLLCNGTLWMQRWPSNYTHVALGFGSAGCYGQCTGSSTALGGV